MLTKEEFLRRAAVVKTKTVRIPELEDEVIVRIVSAGEHDYLDAILAESKRPGMGQTVDVRATYCAHFLSDAEGNRIFSDAEIPQLNKLATGALDAIMVEGMEFNGLACMTVAELEKNSKKTPRKNSGT